MSFGGCDCWETIRVHCIGNGGNGPVLWHWQLYNGGTRKGTLTESFQVSDSNGVSTVGSAVVNVGSQPLVVTVTCGSPNSVATTGKPFNCTVSAVGGTSPYTGTGTFQLIEAVKGVFTESFSVTDSNGVTAFGSGSI